MTDRQSGGFEELFESMDRSDKEAVNEDWIPAADSDEPEPKGVDVDSLIAQYKLINREVNYDNLSEEEMALMDGLNNLLSNMVDANGGTLDSEEEVQLPEEEHMEEKKSKKKCDDDCSCGADCGCDEGASGRKHRKRMRMHEGAETTFKAMIGGKVYKTVTGQEDGPGYIAVDFMQFQDEVPDSDQLYLEDEAGTRYKRVMSPMPEDNMVLFKQM